MLRVSVCQRGFGLLEVVLSTMILSVGLLGGFMVIQNATARSVQGDMNTLATGLANDKMEDVLADKEFKGYGYLEAENYPAEDLDHGFTRIVDVVEVDPQDLQTPVSGSGLKRIEVTVDWGDEAAETVKISTLLTDYE